MVSIAKNLDKLDSFADLFSEPDEVEDVTLAAMIQVCLDDEEHTRIWGEIVCLNSHLIEACQLSKSMNSCSVHIITGGTESHHAISSTFSSSTVQLLGWGYFW